MTRLTPSRSRTGPEPADVVPTRAGGVVAYAGISVLAAVDRERRRFGHRSDGVGDGHVHLERAAGVGPVQVALAEGGSEDTVTN